MRNLRSSLRIGLTTASFRWDQGAERFTVNLARGLLQAGCQVHVIGRLEKKEALPVFIASLDPDQRQRFHFHRVKTIKANKYLNLITFAGAVHHALKHLDLDLVQGFGKSLGLDVFRPPTGCHKAFLLQKRREPKRQLCTFQELALEKRLIYDTARVIVVNSTLSRRRLLDAYPHVPVPVRVIPNMIDPGLWQAPEWVEKGKKLRRDWQLPADAVVGLHLSTAFTSKGVPELLAALETLTRQLPSAKAHRLFLVLVGDRPLPVPPALQNRVRFYPRTETVAPFFHAADVLLHPTHYDAYANVVLEALACGRPVLTSIHDGATDAVENGKNGFITDVVSPEAIARILPFFLEDGRRAVMSAAASKTSARFSPDGITAQYLDLYISLFGGPKTRSPLLIRPWEAFTRQDLRNELKPPRWTKAS